MLKRVLPPKDELQQLSKTLSPKEIALKYGVSRKAVNHHIKGSSSRATRLRQQKRKKVWALWKEYKSPKEIIKETRYSSSVVYRLLSEIPNYRKRLQKIGCSLCKREHYAKGFCRKCYRKDLRRRRKNV